MIPRRKITKLRSGTGLRYLTEREVEQMMQAAHYTERPKPLPNPFIPELGSLSDQAKLRTW